MRLKSLLGTCFSVIALCSCATSSRQPANVESLPDLKLAKTCKADSGAIWEVYNFKGLYSEPADEIHFLKSEGARPQITNTSAPDFTYHRGTLEIMVLEKRVHCAGTEKFDPTTISFLKDTVENYMKSSCHNEQYARSLRATAAELSANQADILNELFTDILNKNATQNAASCQETAERTRKQLEALP